MTRWILTAEADKIQDLIFRSSHLRGVVGGSQLLTRFCTGATPRLLARQKYGDLNAEKRAKPDILVADGGSFTVLFGSENEAREFGRKLAQLYREVTGSTLTIANPVAWSGNDADFPEANEEARRNLAQAKRKGRKAAAVEHLPYAAFCASCGMALAYTHERLHRYLTDERPNYLCRFCRTKANEIEKTDAQGKAAEQEDQSLEFIQKFKQAMGVKAKGKRRPGQADDLAGDWDPRNYVAYLVADGNGMGKVFGKCPNPETLRKLSDNLGDVLRASLTGPTSLLIDRTPKNKEGFLPILPLILGGDDVFILLPASYALDFARCFCLEYEKQMGKTLKDLKIDARPTMSAAVVICKAKYPYTLAHQHGEGLLKEAKRLTKAVALKNPNSPAHSIVHFDLILGSRIAGAGAGSGDKYRAGLRPYWVTKPDDIEGQSDADPYPLAPLAPVPNHVGLPLDRLIDWRLKLGSLPSRRLAQLRALFAPGRLPTSETLGRWQARLGQVIGRVVERGQEQADFLHKMLADLGGQEDGWWYNVSRPGPKPDENAFLGHGLPDLLEMWDFSWKLAVDRSKYEVQEAGR